MAITPEDFKTAKAGDTFVGFRGQLCEVISAIPESAGQPVLIVQFSDRPEEEITFYDFRDDQGLVIVDEEFGVLAEFSHPQARLQEQD